ncbi:alpha/beta fold hydrolase [Streptomyces sp. AS02]|uniref:alpha/beta fold hydrolase n=1 Tax=Streptomyces sp. AS02 TaxID=2938946 RepID=UPI0020214C15|nr:alpha/beta hydrolase [Streptomyces sp. AS02]MCL8010007.1 alpha/beta hydrolase [Streptomyces sp. AS02]
MTVAELNFFASADGDLAYRDAGTGDPVVLLHSGFADHRVFDDQIQALAAHHRVIAPDVRGHGFSANASRPFRWADDLAGLLRHLDTGPAVLVGLCMGAAVATDTALEHPELVRAVVVSGAGTSEFEFKEPRMLEHVTESARLLGAGDIGGWLDLFARGVAGPHRTPDEVAPGVVRRLQEMCAHTFAKHTPGETDWKVPVADTWSRLPKIDVPVLAVHGALNAPDSIAMAERVARTVSDGRSVTVDGVGHYPNLEAPEEFNGILLDFLRTL